MAFHQELQLGKNPLWFNADPIQGQQVTLEGEDYYQIANYDRMRPFFMTVVSDSDHWMFVSSNGALSAGRRNADLALFPYYTDDKIRDMVEVTGSKTILVVQKAGPELSLGTVFGTRPGHATGPGVTSTRTSWATN